ncbi:acyl carrier protein [Streptosporangium sandarakinum]|uniref:acyl carrier protein n=1 Tax=Streptosporangium sandarakinum TaxID=1260955 RepID=UPI003416D049
MPLTRDRVRKDVLDYLADYTSTPDVRTIREDVLLSDLGLDSFGVFNFVLGLEPRFGLEIHDRHLDARRLRSVDGIVELVMDISGDGADR